MCWDSGPGPLLPWVVVTYCSWTICSTNIRNQIGPWGMWWWTTDEIDEVTVMCFWPLPSHSQHKHVCSWLFSARCSHVSFSYFSETHFFNWWTINKIYNICFYSLCRLKPAMVHHGHSLCKGPPLFNQTHQLSSCSLVLCARWKPWLLFQWFLKVDEVSSYPSTDLFSVLMVEFWLQAWRIWAPPQPPSLTPGPQDMDGHPSGTDIGLTQEASPAKASWEWICETVEFIV